MSADPKGQIEEPLINLEEYEARRPKIELITETKTGIACPKCGKELYRNETTCYPTFPPMYPVFCKACDYTGAIH